MENEEFSTVELLETEVGKWVEMRAGDNDDLSVSSVDEDEPKNKKLKAQVTEDKVISSVQEVVQTEIAKLIATVKTDPIPKLIATVRMDPPATVSTTQPTPPDAPPPPQQQSIPPLPHHPHRLGNPHWHLVNLMASRRR